MLSLSLCESTFPGIVVAVPFRRRQRVLGFRAMEDGESREGRGRHEGDGTQ